MSMIGTYFCRKFVPTEYLELVTDIKSSEPCKQDLVAIFKPILNKFIWKFSQKRIE